MKEKQHVVVVEFTNVVRDSIIITTYNNKPKEEVAELGVRYLKENWKFKGDVTPRVLKVVELGD